VVEKNATHGKQVIGFPVVSDQMVSGELGNPIGRSGTKGSILVLRGLGVSEHLAGSGKIESASGDQLPNGGKDMMGPVDIGHQSRKFIFERVSDKTLGRQVIAFIGFHLSHDVKDAGKTLNRSRMDIELGKDMLDPRHPVLRVLDGRAPDDPMDLIAFLQKEFGQVTPILSGYAGDQSFFHEPSFSARRFNFCKYPLTKESIIG